MAHFSTIIADCRLLVLLHHAVVVAAATCLLRGSLLTMAPVLLVRKVRQLLQRRLLVDDDGLQMLLLAVGTVRTKAHHVVDADFLPPNQIILQALIQMLRKESALRSFVAKAALVVRAWLQIDGQLVWPLSVRVVRVLVRIDDVGQFRVPVKALVALEAKALLLEVLANRSLLLDVFVQKRAIFSISAIATQPEGANLQFVLRFIVPSRDCLLDSKDFSCALLFEEKRSLRHFITGFLIVI